ncbi:competence protein ComK [Macrococcoides caseolyticum]|uniref:competence protein ComK n=1 Tax=Macrococcoides caseolyticum TaxID=69966 RepID=UPI000C3372C0|nr:competence protein ComK [Macrococcus caseolyticus]MBQ5153022.1 hypothetical protein [Macrococcus caseolyticus]PKE18262.1 hypothetical protein CW718_00800 [Macrococcus caseolyticus]PKE67559.1 hypothetical protein CW663_07190 [Macrococcus caseolyticus]RKO14337.1 hypothetical protein D6861_06970 [Macrococcus caseolyticus]
MELPISIHTMYLYQYGEVEGRTELRRFNEQTIIMDRAADQLLDDTLVLLGSSLKTRKSSARVLMRTKKYIPIMMEAHLNWAFFQVHQNKQHYKAYINQKYVTYIEGSDEYTDITFLDGAKLRLPQKVKHVQKQYEKCICFVDTQHKIIKRQSLYDCR